MRILYGYATQRLIFSAFFEAKLFGTISPNTSMRKVIIHVAIQTARDSSMPELLAIDMDI